MARAGLEYDTGVMSIGPHALDDCRVGAVEIDQDVAGISALGVGLYVDVTTLAVANAQKSHGGGVSQLSGRPKPFTRERPSGGVVNQTDQIEFVGHRRKLTADGLQSDNESDRKSTRLNSSHRCISYAVFCLKKKNKTY